MQKHSACPVIERAAQGGCNWRVHRVDVDEWRVAGNFGGIRRGKGRGGGSAEVGRRLYVVHRDRTPYKSRQILLCPRPAPQSLVHRLGRPAAFQSSCK